MLISLRNRHAENNVWPSVWAVHVLVKLTHKIHHCTSQMKMAAHTGTPCPFPVLSPWQPLPSTYCCALLIYWLGDCPFRGVFPGAQRIVCLWLYLLFHSSVWHVVDGMCLFSSPSTVLSVRPPWVRRVFFKNYPMFSFIIRWNTGEFFPWKVKLLLQDERK